MTTNAEMLVPIFDDPSPPIDLSDPVKREVFDVLVASLKESCSLHAIRGVRLLYNVDGVCHGKLEEQVDGSWRGAFYDFNGHWVAITQAAEDGAPIITEEIYLWTSP